MKHILTIVLLISAIICIGCISSEKTGESDMEKKIASATGSPTKTAPTASPSPKPVKYAYFVSTEYYQAEIEDLRVNDVSVVPGDIPTGVDIPINQWIQNGENSLKLILKKPNKLGEKNKATIKVMADAGDGEFPEKEVATLEVDLAKGIENETTFTAAVPFPKWPWMDAKQVELTDADKKEMIAKGKQLWEALKNNNMELVYNLLSYRIRWVAITSYTTEETVKADLKDWYKPDSNLKLENFFDEKIVYYKYAGGRLYLILNEFGKSPIYYANQDRSLIQTMDLYFFKDKNGEWQIR